MPKKLTEYTHNLGVREDGSELLRQEVIFGHRAVAEGLVEWSKKQEKGKTFEKHTMWGLTLVAAANGAEPHVQLMLNSHKMAEFLSKIGPCTALCIVEWGISLTGPQNADTQAVSGADIQASIHLGQGDDAVILYNFDPDEEHEDEDFLLGAVNLSEEGFMFFSLEELTETISSETEQEVIEEDNATDEEDVYFISTDDVEMTMPG